MDCQIALPPEVATDTRCRRKTKESPRSNITKYFIMARSLNNRRFQPDSPTTDTGHPTHKVPDDDLLQKTRSDSALAQLVLRTGSVYGPSADHAHSTLS
ncbi:hypothetical protein PoB_001776600 [Plakobranchus ocellatus]|uniref:Uncharacterized protein n=1 Tax=Plakobranchus ocellatus TaxID=259542 RepID=A0AAV3Z5W6_9GAST|nr:hypothetical protein PoB_001776600 [Plakobranchus ocellatus]